MQICNFLMPRININLDSDALKAFAATGCRHELHMRIWLSANPGVAHGMGESGLIVLIVTFIVLIGSLFAHQNVLF
jgi:hypothetical protein